VLGVPEEGVRFLVPEEEGQVFDGNGILMDVSGQYVFLNCESAIA
jgi:hypothetical protein